MEKASNHALEDYVIRALDLEKKYRGFMLNIPSLQVPKGFATALIGENGAGKTTLLNILAGIRLDFKGKISYFAGQGNAIDSSIQERIGYTGPNGYFLPHWTLAQVEEISELLFTHFHKDRYRSIW